MSKMFGFMKKLSAFVVTAMFLSIVIFGCGNPSSDSGDGKGGGDDSGGGGGGGSGSGGVTNGYTLTVNRNPAVGGSVTGAGAYDLLKEADIKAAAGSEYLFTGWSGPVDAPSSASTKVSWKSMDMKRNITVTANFALRNANDVFLELNLSANPPVGGTVSPSGKSDRVIFSEVEITATPAEGYNFNCWMGEGKCYSYDKTTFVTMDHHKTLTADFRPVKLPIEIGPTITLNGPEIMEIFVGDKVNDPGATATHEVYGDLSNYIISYFSDILNSDNVAIMAGEFDISYYMMPEMLGGIFGYNTVFMITRKVRVIDPTPTITLNGPEIMAICVGDKFNDSGATAAHEISYKIYGDLSNSIVTTNQGFGSGILNSDTVAIKKGEFDVIYSITSRNKSASVTRKVSVKHCTPLPMPVIELDSFTLNLSNVSFKSVDTTFNMGGAFTEPGYGYRAYYMENGKRIEIPKEKITRLPASLIFSNPGMRNVTYQIADTDDYDAVSVRRNVLVTDTFCDISTPPNITGSATINITRGQPWNNAQNDLQIRGTDDYGQQGYAFINFNGLNAANPVQGTYTIICVPVGVCGGIGAPVQRTVIVN